ncbi:diguanylate cyclase [Actinoplanes sp. NPDC051633]|uniref:diguanylate cyclase n=1 Tax=Actinoplanes sp. NPDC051633 TaxID=3155670 RepID=UPI0034276C03
MTLRGRLTTAFLVVVLGPVLLGSFFVGATVTTVNRDRAAERLDHAATTVRTAIGAVCRQLQATADAVAVLPADQRAAVAGQLIARGLATEITGEASPDWRDCAEPATGGVAAIAATSDATDGTLVVASQRLDAGFVDRLAASSGADVTLLAHDGADAATVRSTQALGGAGGASGTMRRLPSGPGQPLPLAVSVPADDPRGLYALMAMGVLVVGAGAVLVARGLARSTTRPLAELARAADRVAGGELDTRVPLTRDDELGRLAGAFNRMTRELQSYVQALTASRDQLRGHLAILGDTLSSTHDLHRILQVILQTALSATGARAGLVLLVDGKDNRLVARCAVGLTGRWDVPETELHRLRVPLGHGVLGSVAATGEARRGICGLGGPVLDEPACRTYVAVPICPPVNPDEPEPTPAPFGVLALYDRLGSDEFDDADLGTLQTFAGQTGVAVHNVRVHEEAQRLSLTDPLTGLWNYRSLRESLRREVERASRFGRMLTVLVLDLDHFKEVNDTYGHAAGDEVLGEFARRLRIGLREVDVAFRQGGEEFVVLLPETDAYGGVIVAERLGSAIRDIPVPIDARRVDAATGRMVDRIPISVSIGIAVYPEHGATAQAVLDAADDALYAAKDAGRDTYRLAEVASARVPDGQVNQAGAAPGGPQPPRQSRGR